jgi:XTP/dITP diphosphohydrolase
VELLFVTGNNGKFRSGQLALDGLVTLVQATLDTPETGVSVHAVAREKALAAYKYFQKPVLVDDSGFEIEALGGWPGARVKRELEARGLLYFLDLAKPRPLRCAWHQVLAYMDGARNEPEYFLSVVPGVLISEARGEMHPWIKSELQLAFIGDGRTKTSAEFTEEEYRSTASTNRWQALADFLQASKRS